MYEAILLTPTGFERISNPKTHDVADAHARSTANLEKRLYAILEYLRAPEEDLDKVEEIKRHFHVLSCESSYVPTTQALVNFIKVNDSSLSRLHELGNWRKNASIACNLIELIGRKEVCESLPILRSLVHDKNAPAALRSMAIKALGGIATKESTKELCELTRVAFSPDRKARRRFSQDEKKALLKACHLLDPKRSGKAASIYRFLSQNPFIPYKDRVKFTDRIKPPKTVTYVTKLCEDLKVYPKKRNQIPTYVEKLYELYSSCPHAKNVQRIALYLLKDTNRKIAAAANPAKKDYQARAIISEIILTSPHSEASDLKHIRLDDRTLDQLLKSRFDIAPNMQSELAETIVSRWRENYVSVANIEKQSRLIKRCGDTSLASAYKELLDVTPRLLELKTKDAGREVRRQAEKRKARLETACAVLLLRENSHCEQALSVLERHSNCYRAIADYPDWRIAIDFLSKIASTNISYRTSKLYPMQEVLFDQNNIEEISKNLEALEIKLRETSGREGHLEFVRQYRESLEACNELGITQPFRLSPKGLINVINRRRGVKKNGEQPINLCIVAEADHNYAFSSLSVLYDRLDRNFDQIYFEISSVDDFEKQFREAVKAGIITKDTRIELVTILGHGTEVSIQLKGLDKIDLNNCHRFCRVIFDYLSAQRRLRNISCKTSKDENILPRITITERLSENLHAEGRGFVQALPVAVDLAGEDLVPVTSGQTRSYDYRN